MALTKQHTFKGLNVSNAYAKISEIRTSDYEDFLVDEYGAFVLDENGDKQSNGKKYMANLSIGIYKSADKEYLLDTIDVSIKGLSISNLTHGTLYTKVKETEEWSEWTDV